MALVKKQTLLNDLANSTIVKKVIGDPIMSENVQANLRTYDQRVLLEENGELKVDTLTYYVVDEGEGTEHAQWKKDTHSRLFPQPTLRDKAIELFRQFKQAGEAKAAYPLPEESVEGEYLVAKVLLHNFRNDNLGPNEIPYPEFVAHYRLTLDLNGNIDYKPWKPEDRVAIQDYETNKAQYGGS